MGHFESNGSTLFEIQSIEEGTVSVVEDIKKRLHQDPLGVKPTNSVLAPKTSYIPLPPCLGYRPHLGNSNLSYQQE